MSLLIGDVAKEQLPEGTTVETPRALPVKSVGHFQARGAQNSDPEVRLPGFPNAKFKNVTHLDVKSLDSRHAG